MSRMEQESAERIAKALHRLEHIAGKTKGTPLRVRRAIAALHDVLAKEAADHAEQLGIDVTPLSGVQPKPPRD